MWVCVGKTTAVSSAAEHQWQEHLMVHVFNEGLARVTRRREGAESELFVTGVGLFWRAETAGEACLVAAAVA